MSELVSQVEAIKVEVEHLAKEVEGNFYHSGPENLKKSRSKKTREIKY